MTRLAVKMTTKKVTRERNSHADRKDNLRDVVGIS